MRRHFITGEWEYFDDAGRRERIVYEGQKETKSSGATCSKKPWVSKALAVPVEQAAAFNDAARRNRTGATYVPDGKGYANLVCTSQGSRRREMIARGKQDNDAGYGDYAGQ